MDFCKVHLLSCIVYLSNFSFFLSLSRSLSIYCWGFWTAMMSFAHCLLLEIIFLAFIFFCLFSSQMGKREEKVQKIEKDTFFIFALFLLCERKRCKKMIKCWKRWFWPPSGLQNTCSLSKYTKISFSFCPFSLFLSKFPSPHLSLFLSLFSFHSQICRDITTIWDLFLSSIKCIQKNNFLKKSFKEQMTWLRWIWFWIQLMKDFSWVFYLPV